MLWGSLACSDLQRKASYPCLVFTHTNSYVQTPASMVLTWCALPCQFNRLIILKSSSSIAKLGQLLFCCSRYFFGTAWLISPHLPIWCMVYSLFASPARFLCYNAVFHLLSPSLGHPCQTYPGCVSSRRCAGHPGPCRAPRSGVGSPGVDRPQSSWEGWHGGTAS